MTAVMPMALKRACVQHARPVAARGRVDVGQHHSTAREGQADRQQLTPVGGVHGSEEQTAEHGSRPERRVARERVEKEDAKGEFFDELARARPQSKRR